MILYKILILGDENSNKSNFTIQFFLNQYTETYDPTINDSYRKQVVIDDIPCIIEVFDFSGQEEYMSLDQWIRDGDGFLFVYSISSRLTFERIQIFVNQVTKAKEIDQPPMLLVGNDVDMDTDREVSHEEGLQMATRLGCEFIEASAKTYVNVDRAFYEMVRMIRNRESVPRTTKRRRPSYFNIAKNCVNRIFR